MQRQYATAIAPAQAGSYHCVVQRPINLRVIDVLTQRQGAETVGQVPSKVLERSAWGGNSLLISSRGLIWTHTFLKGVHMNRVRATLVVWGCASACGVQPEAQVELQQVEQAVEQETPELAIDKPLPRPIMVRWADSAPEVLAIRILTANVENTTDQTITAQLSLVASDGTLGTLSAPFVTLKLEPRESEFVEIPLVKFPIQTTLVATSVAVTADFEVVHEAIYNSDARVTRTVQTATEARLVTFDSLFEQATVRTLDAQVLVDTHNLGGLPNTGAFAKEQIVRRVLHPDGTVLDRQPEVHVSLVTVKDGPAPETEEGAEQ